MSARKRTGAFSRRAVILLVSATVVVVGAVIGTVLALSSSHSSTKPPRRSAAANLASAMKQHVLLSPECAPVSGPQWTFPGPTRITSALYESFAIKYPCRDALTWTKRLIQETIPVNADGTIVRVQGPPGFNCGAWADANGHAYAGGCQDGKVAFGWNWNVANPRVVPMQGPTGQVHLIKVYGSDDSTVLRPLGGDRFELYVENTSGIGFINSFTWSPPTRWKIKAITKASGASCSLSAGLVHCVGSVRPPECLCSGSGGNVTLDLVIDAKTKGTMSGKPILYGAEGAFLQLTKMTPLPFLIPGTPKEATRQAKAQGRV
jgi:hypothetical protein